MDKAEQFIKDYTNHCSNLLVFAKGDKEYDYAPWLTPEQALRAVEIAKEGVTEALRMEYEKGRADVIAKTLEWINVFNDNNYIMQYSDSCEHPINEIIEWYKNYINRE